jgi:short-subunit dehydrogenase
LSRDALIVAAMSVLFCIGVLILFRFSFLFIRWVISYVARPVDLPAEFQTDWAVITGAGSGLGRHLSRMVAAQGLNVIGVDRDSGGLCATSGDVGGLGREFVAVVADLTTPEGATTVMAACGDRDVGVVMLNAGLGIFGRFRDLCDDFLIDYIFLMTTSYAILAREFVARNRDRAGRSVIYMTASLASDGTLPQGTIYCSVKAYKSRLLKHLAAETRDTKISWTAMHPGFFRMSGFFRTARPVVQSRADGTRLIPTSAEVAGAVIRTLGRMDQVDLTWQSAAGRIALWALGELPVMHLARIALPIVNRVLKTAGQ